MSQLKLSPTTIGVLKNFASIQKGLVIKPGNVLTTISESQAVIATVKVEETFEKQFAIADIPRFLSVLSLYKEPEINLGDKQMTIKEGKRKLNFTFADEDTILTPPEEEIVLPSVDVAFLLTNEIFKDVEKALLVLKLPEFAVTGNGKEILFRAINSEDPTGDTYSVVIGETEDTFNYIYRAENLKLLPLDYTVGLSSAGISEFKSEDGSVKYLVAMEAK